MAELIDITVDMGSGVRPWEEVRTVTEELF
jgi:hypothetical protein